MVSYAMEAANEPRGLSGAENRKWKYPILFSNWKVLPPLPFRAKEKGVEYMSTPRSRDSVQRWFFRVL